MTTQHPIDQLPAALFPTIPVCWATMTDPETENALDELEDWVFWVVDRYALDHRTVPPCWPEHGALIEDLSALRVAWLAAFGITGRPEAPREWHAQFAAARQRMTEAASLTGCRPSEHRAGHLAALH